jgi:hypothetical protein
LIVMPHALRTRHVPAKGLTAIILAALFCVPMAPVARAQTQWTGIGAIGGAIMYMDTTTIVRAGPLRKVWIRSVDTTATVVIAGSDTLSFDTVIALTVFDCTRNTRSVETVRYMLGEDTVPNMPAPRSKPEHLRAGSFFEAVHDDLCGVRR